MSNLFFLLAILIHVQQCLLILNCAPSPKQSTKFQAFTASTVRSSRPHYCLASTPCLRWVYCTTPNERASPLPLPFPLPLLLPMAANDAADLSPWLLPPYILFAEMSKSSAHSKPQSICSLNIKSIRSLNRSWIQMFVCWKLGLACSLG